ncbi:hypothetical protein [Trueperella bialowiezensis]|uniref:hypothetical protein n=1 Tax=Trueperella bialowiezensis TaxID=312285 RepID=UPI000F830A50|nr:hypothetical protein [Trueperella bialowiezensis]
MTGVSTLVRSSHSTGESGLVRVSRTGGSPINAKQERAQVLIEVWADSQRDSFLLARRLWARFASVSREDQAAFPGLVVYEAVPSMPVEYPDPDTRLVRHQFTVSMIVGLDVIDLPDKQA